ncbi:MAG: hypothetical protein Q7K40_05265 [bacterium]|nr:hypothetical protein [bacterium]
MEYKKDMRERGIERRGTNNGMTVFGVTLSRKCERLTTAIYLVTNFLSDTEPLKGHIRTLCVEMIRGANALKAGGRITEGDVLNTLHANIEDMLSLLEIAFVAGLISEMNFTILKREFVTVRDVVELQRLSRESRTDSILANDFFNTGDSLLEAVRTNSETFVSTNKPQSTSQPQGYSIGHLSSPMSDRNIKGHVQKNSPVERRVVGRRTDHAVSRIDESLAIQSRRVRILKLIKDNREVMIKDIVKHFPDLSEKTIQRELVSFVEGSVLKKMGERRWSRYTLA